MTIMPKLEQDIAHFFGRQYCLLTGSGTTSLYLIFKALQLKENTNVLFPDNTCETAVNAAVFANLNPVFSDIDLTTFSPSDAQLKASISQFKPKVYVATHLFGLAVSNLSHTMDNPPIVIEDAAQGYGLGYKESQIGRMGLASILSFGKEKTLDCGAGGAVLTDNLLFYQRCIDTLQTLSNPPEVSSSLMQDVFFLRKKHSIQNADYDRAYKGLLRKHKFNYLSKIQHETRLKLRDKLDNINDITDKRISNSKRLAKEVIIICGNDIRSALDIPKNSVMWKLPFIVAPDKRDATATALTLRGYEITKFFKPLHKIYLLPDCHLENSVRLHQQIINVAIDSN